MDSCAMPFKGRRPSSRRAISRQTHSARAKTEASQFAYEAGKSGFTGGLAQSERFAISAMGREHLTNYQIAMAELESVVGADLVQFTNEGVK
jgi:hypothetical protein